MNSAELRGAWKALRIDSELLEQADASPRDRFRNEMFLDRFKAGSDNRAAAEGAHRKLERERLDEMRSPIGGRLLLTVKSIPSPRNNSTARAAASVSRLSGVTSVPSTSETTSEISFTMAPLRQSDRVAGSSYSVLLP